MSLSAREQTVVHLYRALDPEQRADIVRSMRALVDANRITQAKMKGRMRVIGNARVEATLGFPRRRPPARAPAKLIGKRTKQGPNDDIDPSMGDALG